MRQHHITLPLTKEQLTLLRAGDQVSLSGTIYTARDAAHQRLVTLLRDKQPLPLELQGAVIYYAGPSPAPPGRVTGSIGPTTSGRMDSYTPALLAAGLAAMIGKGRRSAEVRQAMTEHQAVYFAAIGGAAALLARCVTSMELLAWPELGAEALRKLEVSRMPLVVVNDIHGQDLYEVAEKTPITLTR